MTTLPAFEDLGHGIHCIDTGYTRPGLAACYLVRQGESAAFVDTGTANAAPSLLALLDHLGIAREQVRYVIPTHVHLDHAGASGQLMAACPRARLVVHPRGAQHMIDPAKLTAGATAVYGEEAFERDIGRLEPIEESRVICADDGHEIDLDGRTLTFIDTPGHANHHGCIWDASSGGLFTGDTLGIAYPELAGRAGPWVFAPTTPVAFDPPAWHRSLDRLMQLQARTLYLTHYGAIDLTQAVIDSLRRSIDSLAAMAQGMIGIGENRVVLLKQRVRELLLADAQGYGVELAPERIVELLEMDIDLNAQGLEVWLFRQQRKAET